MESVADTLPQHGRSEDAGPPKRIRRRTLTRVDRRTSMAKRIAALQNLFTSALTQSGVELSPVRKLKVEQAAAGLALAEYVRGRYMRDGTGDLDEVIRAERRADALLRRVGLPPEQPRVEQPASLRDRLGAKYSEGAP